MTPFTIAQPQLAAMLGISIEEARTRRQKFLAEGEDWIRDGNRVLISDAGLKKIRASLTLPALAEAAKKTAAVEPHPEQKTPRRVILLPDSPPPPPGPADVKELVVYRTVLNGSILEAHRAGTDPADRRNIMRVRVRSSENFTRGMVLAVRLVQAPDFYEFTGRLPRWKGKY